MRSMPHKRLTRLGALLAMTIAASPLLAHTPAGVAQYGLGVWTTEQGLPQNSVNTIVQTRDGYLWFGTQEGLARFDGVRFSVFNSRNTPAIRHNDIWKLLDDHDGNLWIATRGGGLTRYRDGVFTNFSKDQGLSN